MSETSENINQTGERAGKGGIIPPVEKRFKPGQTGNPNGRPKLTEEERKERSIQKYLETANAELVQELIESGEYKELLLLAIRNTVAEAKVDGFKFLNDYNGNKPLNKSEVSGNINTTAIELTIEQKEAIVKKYLGNND